MFDQPGYEYPTHRHLVPTHSTYSATLAAAETRRASRRHRLHDHAGPVPVKDWHAFINDPALADAILDRLIHSSHKLELKGDSMRKRKSASAK